MQDAQGDDITFWNSSGTTKLDWDLEKFDPVTGEIVVHIKLPTISSSTGTAIRMYYDNVNFTSYQSDRSAVWTNGYSAIWHFKELITAVGQIIDDATSNNLDLTALGDTWQSSQQVAGKIGFCQQTDKGVNNRFSFTSQNLNGAYTLEGWANISVASNNSNFFGNGASQGDINWFGAAIRQYNGSSDEVVSNTTVSTGTWHHYAFCRSGSNIVLYQDGVNVGSGSSATNKTYQYLANGATGISHNIMLDEVRISTVQRSANWVLAQYRNQNSPGTFYTVGSEQTP